MPEQLSAAAMESNRKSETDKVWLALFEMSHPDIETIRLVGNHEDITSNGNLYTAGGVEAVIPDDNPSELPKPQLTVFDPDQLLTEAIMSLPAVTSERATVSISIIMASEPDTIQVGPFDAELTMASLADGGVVGLTVGWEDLVREGFPSGLVTPTHFNGLT